MSMRIRCGHGAAVALITNRHFRALDWVGPMAIQQAKGLLDKDGDASGLLNIAPADASELLLPFIPGLVKTQKSTGLWRTRNAREVSFYLLKAMAHAGLLDTVLPQLRYDPYLSFRDAEDWYGVAMRGQLLLEPRKDDKALKARVLKELAGLQCADGSWERTVIGTLHYMEILAEAGLTDTPCFAQGVAYLFSCIQPELLHGPEVVAHDMITSQDRGAEHRCAVAYHPNWIPHPACYSHLPMIQSGYAIKLLNKAGYENDPRVKRACRNLVEMRERFGGWCVTNVRLGLLAEAKKNRATRPPARPRATRKPPGSRSRTAT